MSKFQKMDMNKHLHKVANYLQTNIPQNWTGLGVLDFEVFNFFYDVICSKNNSETFQNENHCDERNNIRASIGALLLMLRTDKFRLVLIENNNNNNKNQLM